MRLRSIFPIVTVLLTSSVYAVPSRTINQECHTTGCVQIAHNRGHITLEGVELEIAFNKGVVKIIASTEDKKKIKDSALKFKNLTSEITDYLKKLEEQKQYKLKNTEKMTETTEYVKKLEGTIAGLKERNRLLDSQSELTEQIDKALEYYDITLAKKLLKEKQKIQYRVSANTAFKLAYLQKADLEYQRAVKNYEKAAILCPDNIDYLNHAGLITYQMGIYDKALEYYNKALTLTLSASPKNSPDVAIAYNHIGGVLREQKEYKNALDYFAKALTIQQEALPDNHSNRAITYHNIGVTYFKKGEYDKALEYLGKALEIQRELSPQNPSDIAKIYDDIGSVYNTQGKYNKASDYFDKALAINSKSEPPDELGMAYNYKNISVLHYQQKHYPQSKDYIIKALAILEPAFGKEHPDTHQAMETLRTIENLQAEVKK